MRNPFRTSASPEEDSVIATVSAAEMLASVGAYPWQLRAHRVCPFCNAADYIVYFDGSHSDFESGKGPEVQNNGFVCTGSVWLWGCKLRTGHFHVQCLSCRAKWIMAPANVAVPP